MLRRIKHRNKSLGNKSLSYVLTKIRGVFFLKQVPMLLENVEVFSKFKISGVLIDNKLSFQEHVKNLQSLSKSESFCNQEYLLPQTVKLNFFKGLYSSSFRFSLSLLIYS